MSVQVVYNQPLGSPWEVANEKASQTVSSVMISQDKEKESPPKSFGTCSRKH